MEFQKDGSRNQIVDVITHVLSAELEEEYQFSQGWIKKRSAMIVEIRTSEGITGWGESMCHGLQPPQIAASFVEHCYKPLLLGQDPFNVEVIWETLYNKSRPFGQFGAAINAISGLDIALWDIIGKTVGQPVHRLLGGAFRTKIIPYATGFYRKKTALYPQSATEEAQKHIENGFRAMKLKTGFGVNNDIQYIREVRDAIGDSITLMADFNCAYNTALARRIILELEDTKINFFEELLAPEDMEGYLQIKNLTASYIAAGENIFGKIGYRHWISKCALDILQPDLCSAGGFTECKKIAAIAQAWNTMVIPHVWGTGIGLAASLQFIASLPPTPLSEKPIEPMLEYDQSDHPFRMDLIYGAIVQKNGVVEVPQASGIGVEVNREVLEKFNVQS